MEPGPSDKDLQLNFLTFFEKGLLSDVSIVAQGREVKCHKAVVGSQSDYFLQQFQFKPDQKSFEVPYKFKVIKPLIRFMYFGGIEADLTPEDALDMLILGEEYGIKALKPEEIMPSILPKLTVHNCLSVLLHEKIQRFPSLQEAVCVFVGAHFLNMLGTMEDQLMSIPKAVIAKVLRTTCGYVTSDYDTERVVRFCLGHTQLESACDLLRETKQWNWGHEEVSKLRSPPKEVPASEGPEWCITNVRAAMETTPARIVEGNFFDWCIRLDYGAEGKLRIVYESALPRDQEGEAAADRRCINRFPAAMFAWRVIYRGQDVFNEKPVFICFPENVSLHWSTTLPVSAAELSDEDDLRIMVNMAENPMLSLVLFYFSADLATTVFSEDILNRLPHIEYRCLSSYSLVKTHINKS